jgi:hypothetical protein
LGLQDTTKCGAQRKGLLAKPNGKLISLPSDASEVHAKDSAEHQERKKTKEQKCRSARPHRDAATQDDVPN